MSLLCKILGHKKGVKLFGKINIANRNSYQVYECQRCLNLMHYKEKRFQKGEKK